MKSDQSILFGNPLPTDCCLCNSWFSTSRLLSSRWFSRTGRMTLAVQDRVANLTIYVLQGIKEYEERVPVQQNLGRLHHLEVIGFLITPGTISFRLQLSHEQLKLWNQEEDPEFISGSRAHITIQTARGVPSLVSGMDMIKLGKYSSKITLGNICGMVINRAPSANALLCEIYSFCFRNERCTSPPFQSIADSGKIGFFLTIVLCLRLYVQGRWRHSQVFDAILFTIRSTV